VSETKDWSRTGTVGSKGEIYPPKKAREMLGLKPGDRILLTVRKGAELSIRRIPKLEELLERPPMVSKEYEELERELEEMHAKQAKLSLKDINGIAREDHDG